MLYIKGPGFKSILMNDGVPCIDYNALTSNITCISM